MNRSMAALASAIMRLIVTAAYERPYENPIAVRAGEEVQLDELRSSDIPGWVWCTAADGRSGWTPLTWIERSGDRRRIMRDFNAIELTVRPLETLESDLEESGFSGHGGRTANAAGYRAGAYDRWRILSKKLPRLFFANEEIVPCCCPLACTRSLREFCAGQADELQQAHLQYDESRILGNDATWIQC